MCHSCRQLLLYFNILAKPFFVWDHVGLGYRRVLYVQYSYEETEKLLKTGFGQRNECF
jgi:hypothetical protein